MPDIKDIDKALAGLRAQMANASKSLSAARKANDETLRAFNDEYHRTGRGSHALGEAAKEAREEFESAQATVDEIDRTIKQWEWIRKMAGG